MKTLGCLSLFALLFFANNSFANPNWNIKFSVIDPSKAYSFAKDVLKMDGAENSFGPVNTPYRVKFRDSPLQLHFNKITNTDSKYLASLEKMTLENTFIKNHPALIVNDLDYYLKIFIENKIEFMGPIKRSDGMYQLYFEIPDHAFIEFQSEKEPELAEIITIRDVRIETEVKEEPPLDPFFNH